MINDESTKRRAHTESLPAQGRLMRAIFLDRLSLDVRRVAASVNFIFFNMEGRARPPSDFGRYSVSVTVVVCLRLLTPDVCRRR